MISIHSQRFRIAAVIFFLTALLVGAMAAALVQISLEDRRARAETREKILLELTGKNCRQALITGEYASTQLFLEELGTDPNIEALILADAGGRIVCSPDYAQIGAPLDTASLTDPGWRTQQIADAAGRLGLLGIRFSPAEGLAVRSKLVSCALYLSLPVITLIAALAWLLASLLSRRLERLKETVLAIQSGRHEARADSSGSDEIAQLACAFNAMADTLETSLHDLQAREVRFRSLFENIHVVALVIDPESGAILDVNSAAERFYGWSKAELKSMNIAAINTLSPAEIQGEMAAALSAKRTCFNFRHRLAGGEIRDVEVYSGQVPSGEKPVLYSIIHDVTQRIRAERGVEEARAELERRVAERTATLEERTRELNALNKFFVGRELRMAELKEEIERLKTAKDKA